MAWVKPLFSRSAVDKAGQALKENPIVALADAHSLDVLNSWRASHSFPLNTLKMGLRTAAQRISSETVVAQRLKRVPSIALKLLRFPRMRLSQMQDIGGVRAVMTNLTQVARVREHYRSSRMKHVLADEKDYITNPKPSGYRGIHLVYRYRSDRNETYNRLLIEVQLRSALQHTWATAVEAVSALLNSALKSSEGPEQWLHYFRLVSSAFALLEKTPTVPGTPASVAILLQQIQMRTRDLDVIERLRNYRQALRVLSDQDHTRATWFLLRFSSGALSVRGYPFKELLAATEDYLRVEKELDLLSGEEAVLVSVDSPRALRLAYPNYFLDTKVFAEIVDSLNLVGLDETRKALPQIRANHQRDTDDAAATDGGAP